MGYLLFDGLNGRFLVIPENKFPKEILDKIKAKGGNLIIPTRTAETLLDRVGHACSGAT